MVSTQTTRTEFIQSAITLLRTYGFDGLSLEWWFPSNPGCKNGVAMVCAVPGDSISLIILYWDKLCLNHLD
uniref:GH18 domain-containing protein n=1 Tax=Seriola dumerili TaxID=41447 RepID=A0A3B4V3I9_SERDU